MSLHKILPSTKYVMENAKNVTINYKKIDSFFENFTKQEIHHWLELSPIDLNSFTKEEKIKFFILMDSINFSFWGNPKWEYYYQNKTYSGSSAMVIALFVAVTNNKELLTSNKLKSLKITNLKEIFLKDKQGIYIPMIEERLQNMKNVGEGFLTIETKYKKDISVIIDNMKDEEELFKFISKYFKSFINDFAKYKGKNIYFYKRLQLLINDINEGAYNNKKFKLNKLTVFADYKIPQLMRALDFISYSYKLSKIVDSTEEIKKNSYLEIEIRASIIQVTDYIVKQLKKQNIEVNSAYLDSYMFNTIKTSKDLITKPHHQVRTTNY
ncbi:MAG: queuosine salvage family protein [Bacilli bacterium]|nr:queuosine salvage family protein [Bacilli bacterium]